MHYWTTHVPLFVLQLTQVIRKNRCLCREHDFCNRRSTQFVFTEGDKFLWITEKQYSRLESARVAWATRTSVAFLPAKNGRLDTLIIIFFLKFPHSYLVILTNGILVIFLDDICNLHTEVVLVICVCIASIFKDT